MINTSNNISTRLGIYLPPSGARTLTLDQEITTLLLETDGPDEIDMALDQALMMTAERLGFDITTRKGFNQALNQAKARCALFRATHESWEQERERKRYVS